MRMSFRPWLILAFGSLLSSAAEAQLPTLSIQDTSVIEGNIGTTNADFIVNVSAASSFTITVSYTTMDGSATVADSDYQARSGTLTIFAGQTTGTISVPVVGDTKPEQNETFTVVLSNPINATIARGTATGTILNDDGVTPTNTASFTPSRTSTPTRTFSATATRDRHADAFEHPDADRDCHRDAHSHIDGNVNADIDENQYGGRDFHGDADVHDHADAELFADSDIDRHADADRDAAHGHADFDFHSDADANSHGDRDAADVHSHPDAFIDQYADADRDGHADADVDADAGDAVRHGQDTATPTTLPTATQTPVGPTATAVPRAPVILPRERFRQPPVVPLRTPT